MATDITTRASTRGRGLQTAAALTVFFFTTTALAQTPAPAPVPPTAPPPVAAPTTTAPKAATPPKTTPPTPPKSTPPSAPSTAPAGPDDRALGDEIPTSIEAPPAGEAPPPTDVASEPPPPEVPAETPPPPPPETVGPPPPPTPPLGGPQSDSITVKDQEAANDMRRKGLGIMIAGGVVTVAGAVTSIAFTVRGTQYEGLLIETEEAYNRANCSGKATIKPGGTCEQLSNQVDKNRASIDFDDRATRVAGAAIAAGVLITVAGGIIYRLGVNKLKAGNFARVKMAPAIGRNFGGLMLTGRF